METKRLKVLVSGSGIAGAAAALCLHRAGHGVTVLIDRVPSAMLARSLGKQYRADDQVVDAVGGGEGR